MRTSVSGAVQGWTTAEYAAWLEETLATTLLGAE
jgi:hypothetical protein